MARARKMAAVAGDGTRLEQLKNLKILLAKQIDLCAKDLDKGPVRMPALAKQYRDTIREIEDIEGVDMSDDEIGEILSAREVDGKSDAIR